MVVIPCKSVGFCWNLPYFEGSGYTNDQSPDAPIIIAF